jgi:hypothetical protein
MDDKYIRELTRDTRAQFNETTKRTLLQNKTFLHNYFCMQDGELWWIKLRRKAGGADGLVQIKGIVIPATEILEAM